MQWDDLKVALALGAHGTVAGASRELGVTTSTVNRRLASLEEALGVRLFDRMRAGLQPTDAGARLLHHAEAMKRQAAELELSVLDGDQRLIGPVSLTCSATLLPLVAKSLAAFVREHEHVELIVRTGDHPVDMGQREADVALRMTPNPPESLVGRKLCSAAFGVYGQRSYVTSAESPRLVGEDDGVADPSWSSGGVVATRANHLDWTLEAVRQGLGLGRLPCFIGDSHPELRRVGDPLDGPQLGIWVLTHERLRGVARVRALITALTEALMIHVELFEGRHTISASQPRSE